MLEPALAQYRCIGGDCVYWGRERSEPRERRPSIDSESRSSTSPAPVPAPVPPRTEVPPPPMTLPDAKRRDEMILETATYTVQRHKDLLNLIKSVMSGYNTPTHEALGKLPKAIQDKLGEQGLCKPCAYVTQVELELANIELSSAIIYAEKEIRDYRSKSYSFVPGETLNNIINAKFESALAPIRSSKDNLDEKYNRKHDSAIDDFDGLDTYVPSRKSNVPTGDNIRTRR